MTKRITAATDFGKKPRSLSRKNLLKRKIESVSMRLSNVILREVVCSRISSCGNTVSDPGPENSTTCSMLFILIPNTPT